MVSMQRRLVLYRPVYEAQKCGAHCSACPLRKSRPVPPEIHSSSLAILGESPGPTEDEEGRVFIGPSGKLLNKALAVCNVQRDDVHVTNAVLCFPKDKLTRAEWDQALHCCRPRLKRELEGKKTVLALGAKALQTLTGKAEIIPWMGGPLHSEDFNLTVIPSIHPAFCLRKPAYIPVFKTFVSRAVRENFTWDWGRLIVEPPYAPYLKELANESGLSVDIENNPSTGVIRCIGVGSRDLAVSVPLLQDGVATSQEDIQALRDLLASPIPKIVQNGQHDRSELKKHGWTLNGPFFDLLLAHAVCAPRLPHDLGFMASVEFPAPRWKSIFKVHGEDKGGTHAWFGKAPIKTLLDYNCKDNIGQARLAPILRKRIGSVYRGQELLEEYQKLDEITLKMSEKGILIDTSKFEAHRTELNKQLDEIRCRFDALQLGEAYSLGKNGQNKSLNHLFFNKLQVPAIEYSEETGAPSLNNKALEHYIKRYSAEGKPFIADLARLIRQYRAKAKLLGSYIENLPIDQDTHKIHPRWRIFGTRTGRWSATNPAIQTIPKELRDLFAASSNNFLVESDYSQLELRIVALLAADNKLLQWYAEGLDVHTMNARDIFGSAFDQADDKKRSGMRKLAKNTVYGMNYGGGAKTIWGTIVVQVPGIKLEAIEYIIKRWFELHPDIKAWQDGVIETAKKNGYVEAPISGRRQYYHDGAIVPTEVLNFPIQSTAGDIANKSIMRIVEAGVLPLAQIHDSLLCEGPDPIELGAKLKWAMEHEVSVNSVKCVFPVDVKYGKNWLDMKELPK